MVLYFWFLFQIHQHLLGLARYYSKQGYSLHCVPVGEGKNLQLATDLAKSSGAGNIIDKNDYKTASNYLRYQVSMFWVVTRILLKMIIRIL